MRKENISDIEELLDCFEPPVLIVSTVVGRGMYYIGEAVREMFPEGEQVHHVAIEDFMPPAVVNEDLRRYKLISCNFPFLLYIIYHCPLIFYRKYLREKLFNRADLGALEEQVTSLGVKTIICISHRAAFWVSNLKRRRRVKFGIWDVLGEYGNNYGYKYIFWDEMDGFLSPVSRSELKFDPPPHVRFARIALPARREYHEIGRIPGDHNRVLLVCGFWGQGPIDRILGLLRSEFPGLRVHAVCGENEKMYESIRSSFGSEGQVDVHGIVPFLTPLLKECASIITKPGISTILESQAARRKIFLLKGMPVAEDNNARYAISHFGAEWFTVEGFRKWYGSQPEHP